MIFGPTHEDVDRVRTRASDLRRRLNLSCYESFSIVEILEFEIPEKIYRGFVLVVGTDDRFPEGILAFARANPPQIVVRERVYCDAAHGDLFGRHTLAHELGHIYLSHKTSDEEIKWGDERASNLEWEANEFASELLMPSHVVRDMSISEIVSKFKVSTDFASERLTLLRARAESPRLRESLWANSQLKKALNSRLYDSRPRFLETIASETGLTPNDVMSDNRQMDIHGKRATGNVLKSNFSSKTILSWG